MPDSHSGLFLMNHYAVTLSKILLVSAILNSFVTLIFSVYMAVFAVDAPGSSLIGAAIVFIISSVILFFGLVHMPLAARKQLSMSLLPTKQIIFHAAISWPFGPWAPFIAIAELFFLYKAQSTHSFEPSHVKLS